MNVPSRKQSAQTTKTYERNLSSYIYFFLLPLPSTHLFSHSGRSAHFPHLLLFLLRLFCSHPSSLLFCVTFFPFIIRLYILFPTHPFPSCLRFPSAYQHHPSPFVLCSPLPPLNSHVVMAPSSSNTYASQSFPGFQD